MKNTDTQGKEKKKKFNLFDWYYNRGKENDKEAVNALKDPSIPNFFSLLGSRIGKLISSNLIVIFGNFPLFFLLLAMSNALSVSSVAPLTQAWGPLCGANTFNGLEIADGVVAQFPSISPLLGAFGATTKVSIINTPTIVCFCLGLLIIFTWGFTRVGTTYIYRNMMSGEPVFPLSDALYIIKRNIKQSLLLGVFDAIMIVLFAYNIFFLSTNYNAATMNSFMLFMTVAMAILYSFARPYAYIMVFTFDLKLRKILKNALYFTILGVKRNLVAFIGTFIVVALNYFIFTLFMPVGALLPFVFTIALCDFIAVYAAYPNIIKYMMDEKDAKAIIERKHFETDEEIDEEEYEDDDEYEEDDDEETLQENTVITE